MNELIMPEGVADSGIRELSLDEAETISGGNNTRGVPRRPMLGGSSIRGGVFGLAMYAFDLAANYVRDRWGDQIHGVFYREGNGRSTGGQMSRSMYKHGK